MSPNTQQLTVLAPQPGRGKPARVFSVPVSQLNPQQREILRLLPRDRSGLQPVLRGPGNDPAAGCKVALGDQVRVAKFLFFAPPQATDGDLPALIDLWGHKLSQARAQLIKRFEKGDRRLLKPPNAPKRRSKRADPESTAVEPAASPSADLLHPVHDADGEPPQDGPPSDGDPVGEGGDTLGEPLPGGDGWELPDAEEVHPLASLRSALATVLALPSLGLPASPGATEGWTADGATWTAIATVRAVGTQSVDLSDIRPALLEALGPTALEPATAQTLDERFEHARQRVATAMEELRRVAATLGRRRGLQATVLGQELLEPVDLLRCVFVDLSTAPLCARLVLDEPGGHPEWLLSYAALADEHSAAIETALATADLQPRLTVLLAWSSGLKPLAAAAAGQLSLWASPSQQKLQRRVEPQVHRAARWASAWQSAPGAALAALALYGLLD